MSTMTFFRFSLMALFASVGQSTAIFCDNECISEPINNSNNTTATFLPDGIVRQNQERILSQADWDEVSQITSDEAAIDVWERAREYMTNSVLVDPAFDKVREQCRNKHSSCSLYASQGECTNNPHWMRLNCGPACQVCDELDISKRCPIDPTAPELFEPGDLHDMYERIVNDFGYFHPKVHSKPGGDSNNPSIINGPWVITLETFLSGEETDDLIEAAEKRGLKPSIGKTVKRRDGTYDRVASSFRTSTSAYCHDECYLDPITRSFNSKLENVTGTPHSHSTHLHFLRYESSQFYVLHSDYVKDHLTDQQHGVRLMTVLTYLSDVEEGGGTRFPALDLTIQPKRGRVVIFPNVLNHLPNKEEKRTRHEALPVVEGVKYAVSMYVHQKDYKTPFEAHCIR